MPFPARWQTFGALDARRGLRVRVLQILLLQRVLVEFQLLVAIQILILGGRLGWDSTSARHPTCDAAADVAYVISLGDVVVLVTQRRFLLRHLAIPVPVEVLLGERPARLGRAE